jgi:hypothetical protein
MAAAVGLNRVQARWRLERLRQRLADKRERAARRVEHIRYEHKTCPRCGRVNDRTDSHCSGCGTPLGAQVSPVAQVIETALAGGVALGLIVAVLLPLASPLEESFAAAPGDYGWQVGEGEIDARPQTYFRDIREICAHEARGELALAQARWTRLFGATSGMELQWLPQHCRAVRAQQEQCRRLAAGERVTAIWPEFTADQEEDAAGIVKDLCASLLAAEGF